MYFCSKGPPFMGDRYGFDPGIENGRFLNPIVYEPYGPMVFEKDGGHIDGIKDYRRGALWWQPGNYETRSHLLDPDKSGKLGIAKLLIS